MKRCWQSAAALLLIAGCSGRPGAIRPPDVDAEGAAAQAIELFDKSGDGQLGQQEWSASPALSAVSKAYDANGDGNLTGDEIVTGLNGWQQSGVGARVVPFRVTLDGQRLIGAVVKLTPAPFLGDAIKGASGETGASGAGQLSMAAEDRPRNAPDIALMQPGLFHVEITHASKKIPAKYNTQTTLGIEITGANPGPEGAVWSLTSK
jgi:hypothetical protein